MGCAVHRSPEKVVNWISHLKTIHTRHGLSCIAIDESHCISEWGNDFRPAYRNLRLLKNHFPNVPMLALTATATQKVRTDIIQELGLRNNGLLKIVASFDRSNLKYLFVRKVGMVHDLGGNYFRDGSTIICLVFCSSFVLCSEIVLLFPFWCSSRNQIGCDLLIG